MEDISTPVKVILRVFFCTHDPHVVIAQVIRDGFCDAGLLSNTQYRRVGTRWHDMLMMGGCSIAVTNSSKGTRLT